MRLLGKLESLIHVVSIGDYKPTDQAQAAFEDLDARVDEKLKDLKNLVQTDLSGFNNMLKENDVPNIVVG